MQPAVRTGAVRRRSFVAGAMGLTAAATSGLLSGCGPDEAVGASPESLAAPPVTPGPKTGGIVYPDGYVGPVARKLGPIVTEPTKFVVVVPQDLTVGDWAKNKFTKWLEQRTGITIEFRQVAGADEDVTIKVNAMIAAGDIPDAFMGVKFSPSQLYLYGAQNLFVDQTAYTDKYAPNLQQMFHDYPLAKKLSTSPDGNVYVYPSFNDCYHCRAGKSRTWINTRWLRQVGLAIPKTTDEFREVLRAFKKADPAGGGRTLPFVGYKEDGTNQVTVDKFVMNSFLFNPTSPWLVVDGGKVKAAYSQDGWREGLKYLRTLYGEGLLNRDAFSMTAEQLQRAGNNKDGSLLGVFQGNYWGSAMDVDVEDPNARWHDYEALPPLTGPDGFRVANWDHYTGFDPRLVITRRCRRPDLLVKWADFQLDLEVMMAAYAGPGSWSFAKRGDKAISGQQALFGISGTWAPDKTKDTWAQRNPNYRSGDFRLSERVDPTKPTFEKPLYEQTRDRYFPYAEPIEQQFPPVALEGDQAALDASLLLDLSGEVVQTMARFVTGKADPADDGQWNDYLGRLDKIGLRPYLDIQQAAYESFQG
ncbi:extracellular solute-binding protein [Kribbella italica]|uniref:Putative aldouronate transport system substrate-binding protein n=1 Tax=Kribbella italica TaxID=1540520 RepID=A0A7W9J2R5_9ACTN|nr:putative aldouronate transport system substrate-binding protein [Kribbella italica]